MAKIKTNTLSMKLEGPGETSLPRPYLGMSQLGSSCRRALWYYFRWTYKRHLDARKLRIFARGSLEEDRVLPDLERAGVQVLNRQLSLIGYKGHCKGHTDGTLANVPTIEQFLALCEIKTGNDAGFKKLKAQGLQAAYPEYYSQTQIYMKHGKLEVCLFIMTNKNTEERHYEIVFYDEDHANDKEKVAIEVIDATEPPPKIGGPTWFECKMCDAYDVCQYQAPVYKCCRNCARVEVRPDGIWFCNKFNKELTIDEQAINRPATSCYEPLLVSG